MKMLFRIIALIIKEFQALMKEPKSRLVVIVPPILQTLVFGYASSYDINSVRYAVLNEDSGYASRELLSKFEGSPTFHEAARITNVREIPPLVDKRDVLMVVHIHPQFTRDLLRDGSGQVQLIVDGRNSNTALIALNYARAITTQFAEDWRLEHGAAAPPARLEVRAWFNPNLASRWFFVPGIIAVLTLVITVLVTALSVAREREQGTFDQLLVTPYRPFEILIGKALPGFFIGMFEGTLILSIAVFWFRVPLRGDLWLLYLGLAFYLLSTIGVGLMISSMSATMQQGLLGGFLFMVPAITISGFTTPIANMPEIFQKLTLINPVRYFLVIIHGVFLQDIPVSVVAQQLWPMALIGIATMTMAAFLFRRRLY